MDVTYTPTYAVKKRDVDTFLSESSRAQFDLRLLVATTNLIGATARRTLGPSPVKWWRFISAILASHAI